MMNADWNREFLQEFEDFPGGKHDDQIDACSIGFTKLTGKKSLAVTWGRSSQTSSGGVTQPTQQETALVNRQKTGIVFGR